MPADLALLSPTDESDAIELGRTLWRKQLLPEGTISYKGRKISFTRDYLGDLAQAYKDKAFDQVAFMLAKDDNSHTMDPERYRGEVVGVELTPKGLDVLLELTESAADLVRENPKLGVSARIIEGLERADGKKFPRAIQHVLGTLDPRVTGMSSWKQVSLSEEVTDTFDMSGDDVEWDSAAEEPSEGEEVIVVFGDEKDNEIAQLKADLARERYLREFRTWVDRGVPPAIVQLAKPVLENPNTVIDLSNGDTLDVAQVVRGMLEECTGFIELAVERGNNYDGMEINEGETEGGHVEALLATWAKDTK